MTSLSFSLFYYHSTHFFVFFIRKTFLHPNHLYAFFKILILMFQASHPQHLTFRYQLFPIQPLTSTKHSLNLYDNIFRRFSVFSFLVCSYNLLYFFDFVKYFCAFYSILSILTIQNGFKQFYEAFFCRFAQKENYIPNVFNLL